MDKIVIVNEQDNTIGAKGYAELKYKDIYQVSVLWLTDINSGDILLTQRKWSKHNDPGKWMAAASGTVDEGETYQENMIKEIEEEIGLKDLSLAKGPKEFIEDGKHQFFAQWFLAQVDKHKATIKIQEDEVEAYAWVPKEKLIKEVKANPNKYVPSFENSLKLLGIIE